VGAGVGFIAQHTGRPVGIIQKENRSSSSGTIHDAAPNLLVGML
jgi:hypothetical protein